MKQILLLVAITATMLTGCKDDPKGQRLDPDAMISLRAAQGVKADSKAENPKHLSALEIVKQTTIVSFWNKSVTANNALERGFSPDQRDLVNQRLLMFGNDIINTEGEYVTHFIEGEDYLLEVFINPGDPQRFRRDTIAYIPNQVIRDARAIIKPAFDNGDYATVYSAFDKAFVYTPITGKEWRALKAAGKN